LRYRQEEKRIEKEILMFLMRKGIFCWKQNTVGVYDEKIGRYRKPKSPFIISGISDILGLINGYGLGGRLIAIEVKTPERKNNSTKYQKEFIDNVNKNGGIAFVACCVQDVIDGLKLEMKLPTM
jgi:hypothetical protein